MVVKIVQEKNALREYLLDEMFADSPEEEISFQQWQGTDRAMACYVPKQQLFQNLLNFRLMLSVS